MNLTPKDLELHVNELNKPLYNTMFDLVVIEFERALKFTDFSALSESQKEAIGTCGIYISSIVELLNTLRDTIDKGYIESGGAIATACWERAITLRKILIEPEINSQIHVDHEKAKKLPWQIRDMVSDVLAHQRKVKNIKEKMAFEEQNFYLQYTFLSAIKHGNPYTISYLNRDGYSSDEKLFRFKANDSFEDRDLKIYIKMLVADTALDALIDYSKIFRTNLDSLNDLRANIDGLIKTVGLSIPQIFITNPSEMGNEFWNYLIKVEAKRKL